MSVTSTINASSTAHITATSTFGNLIRVEGTGTSTILGRLSISATSTIAGYKICTQENGVCVGGAFTSSGGYTTLRTATDLVGIGTSTPAEKLSLNGGAFFDSDIIRISSSSAASLTIKYFSRATSTIPDLIKNSFSFATSTTAISFLSLDTLNYRVGVGTTSPITTFAVKGHCVTGDTRLRRRRRRKRLRKTFDVKERSGETSNVEESRGEYIYDEVMIKDIQEGDEILTLNENTGDLVWSPVRALMYMGEKPIYKFVTTSGKTIRTTAEHPYLVKTATLLASLFRNDSWQSHENKSQSNNDSYKIDDEHIVHRYTLADSQRLVNHNVAVAARPIIALSASNLSNTAGKTTEANITTPVSEEISESFTSWVSDNLHIQDYFNVLPPTVKSGRWMNVAEIEEGMEIAVMAAHGETATWERIEKIEKLPSEDVYDIEVENAHNFIGNDIVAHNTYITGGLGVGNATTTAGVLETSGLSFIGGVLKGASTFTFAGTGSSFLQGALGIATTTPAERFSINGGAFFDSSYLRYGSSTAPNLNFRYFASSTSTIPNLTSAFRFATSTTNTPLLTLSTKSSRYGRVGIGTSTPSALFAINALNSSNQADNIFYIGSSTINAFVIDNHGNIGIGTSSRSTSKARLAVTGFGTGTNRILALADVNNNEVLTVRENGNVGIGTTSPVTTFSVASTNTGGVYIKNGVLGIGTANPGGIVLHARGGGGSVVIFERTTEDGEILRFDRAGLNKGGISVSGETISYNAFTGSHYAWTDEEIERGMLVSMTGENRYNHDNPQSEIIYGIKKSVIPNDPAILGVYLSLQEPSKPKDDNNHHLVMAVGNGDMWVVDMGQNLEAGDYLISSVVSGHAMKENGTYSPAYVIARVAEYVDWSNVTETIYNNGTPRKHKKISVLFESYKLYAPLAENIQQVADGTATGWFINQTTGELTSNGMPLNLQGADINNVNAIMSASGSWRIDQEGKLVVKSIETQELQTQVLRIKNQELSKTGITIYDTVTGKPGCVQLVNGMLQNMQGECTAVLNQNDQNKPLPDETASSTSEN